jgi:hypothetical protein
VSISFPSASAPRSSFQVFSSLGRDLLVRQSVQIDLFHHYVEVADKGANVFKMSFRGHALGSVLS